MPKLSSAQKHANFCWLWMVCQTLIKQESFPFFPYIAGTSILKPTSDVAGEPRHVCNGCWKLHSIHCVNDMGNMFHLQKNMWIQDFRSCKMAGWLYKLQELRDLLNDRSHLAVSQLTVYSNSIQLNHVFFLSTHVQSAGPERFHHPYNRTSTLFWPEKNDTPHAFFL